MGKQSNSKADLSRRSSTKEEIDEIVHAIQSTAIKRLKQLRFNIAAVVRHLREGAGISACSVASYAGVSRSYVSRVEAGEVLPSEKLIYAYETLCDTKIDIRYKPEIIRKIKEANE